MVHQSFGNLGMDMMSTAIMHEAVHNLNQLGKDGAIDQWRSKMSKSKGQSSPAETTLGYTTWATFVSTTATTYAMRRNPLMRPPSVERPPLCEGYSGEHWFPYPRDGPAVVAHPNCHLHYLSRLYELCYHISEHLFANDPNRLDQDVLEDLHRDLTEWYDSLIECLQIHDIMAPHTLSVQ
jgi:hypothetical protein